MFKLPKPEDQQKLIEQYKVLGATQKKVFTHPNPTHLLTEAVY